MLVIVLTQETEDGGTRVGSVMGEGFVTFASKVSKERQKKRLI